MTHHKPPSISPILPPRPPRPLWQSVLKWTIFAVVAVFVVRIFVQKFQEADWSQFHPNIGLVLLSLMSMIISRFLSVSNYRTVLAGLGHPVNWPAAVAVAWIPQLGKYIPGKLATVAGGVWVLRNYGVPAPVAASVILLISGLLIIAGLILSVPLMFWDQVYKAIPLGWLWCMLILIGGIVCLHPRVMGPVANFALSRLRRPAIKLPSQLRYYLGPLASIFLQWTLLGLSLWLMARAVMYVPFTSLPLFTSASAFSQSMGILAFFAPAGLGVRDGLLLKVLEGPTGGANALVIVIATRLLQIIVDVGLAVLGRAILRRYDPKTADKSR